MSFSTLSAGVAWLVIAGALAAAAGMFLIRPRPSRLVVPSLVVWRRLTADAHAPTLGDRIRWLLSLGLTLVIAAAMALAFTQPAGIGGGAVEGPTLIVLDSSWSMQARTSPGQTRWDQALAGARALADATLAPVALATTAEGIVEGPTHDRALIRAAFDRLVPSGADDAAWPAVAGAASHFFTDGARSRLVPAGVTVHSVFTPAPNVAVTAFAVRGTSVSGQAADVFVAVANYAPAPQAVHLVITRGAAVILDRTVDLAAGAGHRESIAVAREGDPRFHAHVTATENALDLDDDRAAWLAAARPLQVAVVGASSLVPALLASDASIRVAHVDPATYATTAADVWIFDRWLPPAAPNVPALVIDPPASPWFGDVRSDEAQPVWRSGIAHPVLVGVDTALMPLARAHAVSRPALEVVAMSARETPLVSVEDDLSGRYVVLGFAADEAFAGTPAFPVLIGNAIDWLARRDEDSARRPGPVALPATTRRLVDPNGNALPLTRFGDAAVATLPAPGLYLVESPGSERVLVVEPGDPRRSNLMLSTVAPDEARVTPPSPHTPWWSLAALAALGLAGLEWVTWRRRLTV